MGGLDTDMSRAQRASLFLPVTCPCPVNPVFSLTKSPEHGPVTGKRLFSKKSFIFSLETLFCPLQVRVQAFLPMKTLGLLDTDMSRATLDTGCCAPLRVCVQSILTNEKTGFSGHRHYTGGACDMSVSSE